MCAWCNNDCYKSDVVAVSYGVDLVICYLLKSLSRRPVSKNLAPWRFGGVLTINRVAL